MPTKKTRRHDRHRMTRAALIAEIKGLERRLSAAGRRAAQKGVEEKLSESERRLRAFVDHSPSEIVIKDRKGRYLGPVARRHGLLPYEGRHHVGKTARDIYPKTIAAEVEARDRLVLRTGLPVEVENVIRTKKGLRRFIILKFPIRDARGEITAIGSIATDITRQMDAEVALRESEARFRDLVEGSVQGVLIANASKVLFVNQAFADMFGYTRQEIIAMRNFRKLYAPAERERVKAYAFARMQGKPAPMRYEYQAVRKDGSIAWHENTARVVAWKGKPAIQSTIIDRSEQKRAEERARLRLASVAHARRIGTVGELTTSLAHELNQPLAALTAYLEGSLRIARAERGNARDLLPPLTNAFEQANRMDSIIRRLRTFIRRRKPVREKTDANAVIRDALDLLYPEAQRLGVVVKTRFARNLPRIHADRVQIEQVVLNLVRNGLDAVQEKGTLARRIEVRSTHTRDDRVAIEVADRGPGLAKNRVSRLFRPFVTTKTDGLGLGLAICRWIVEDHGGRIGVVTHPRGGAVFRVVLPRDG